MMKASGSQKAKRRSSKRTSLLVTLQNIRSEESAQVSENQPADASDGEVPAKKLKMAAMPAVVLESIEPLSAEEKIVDDYVTAKLQLEADSWAKQLMKYRSNAEKDTLEFNGVLDDATSKYKLWNEQIDELEAKVSSSVAVINNFMEWIYESKASHQLKIQQLRKSLYEKRLEKFETTDPKVIISDIFRLYRELNDS